MYEEIQVVEQRRPSLFHLMTEIPRTLVEMTALSVSLPLLSTVAKGDGHTVMVLPGFLAGDESTAVLRSYLRTMKYRPYGWGLGRNTGKFDLMASTLPEAFLALCEKAEGKITLIGQSLGGVYARELARLYPDKVRQVISLGSPITMDKTNEVATLVSSLFEKSTGMTPEEMKQALEFFDESQSPPVPMTAIYSHSDGVVHWEGCIEAEEDHQTQNIRVCSSHCGMAFHPAIYHIIADRLSQPADDWQKYELANQSGPASSFAAGAV